MIVNQEGHDQASFQVKSIIMWLICVFNIQGLRAVSDRQLYLFSDRGKIKHPGSSISGELVTDKCIYFLTGWGKIKHPGSSISGDLVTDQCIYFLTGWGKIKHPGSSHPILQQARLPPVKKDVCAKKLAASPGS